MQEHEDEQRKSLGADEAARSLGDFRAVQPADANPGNDLTQPLVVGQGNSSGRELGRKMSSSKGWNALQHMQSANDLSAKLEEVKKRSQDIKRFVVSVQVNTKAYHKKPLSEIDFVQELLPHKVQDIVAVDREVKNSLFGLSREKFYTVVLKGAGNIYGPL